MKYKVIYNQKQSISILKFTKRTLLHWLSNENVCAENITELEAALGDMKIGHHLIVTIWTGLNYRDAAIVRSN